MGPYARVEYNLTLCLVQSRLQQNYYRQPYATVDLNPMPDQSQLYPPVRYFGFGLNYFFCRRMLQYLPQSCNYYVCISSIGGRGALITNDKLVITNK
jgi:hypothetical protein